MGLRVLTVACLAAALLIPAGSAGAGNVDGKPGARVTAYRASCGTLAFRGKHKLMQRNVGCRTAKRYARYVIKRRKEPQGFECSLARLDKGYASCAGEQKSFAIAPA